MISPQVSIQKMMGRVVLVLMIIFAPMIAIYQVYLIFCFQITLISAIVTATALFLSFWYGRRPAMKSKYFKLYHIVIDSRSSLEFFEALFRDNQVSEITPDFLTYAPSHYRSRYGLQGHQIVGILLRHGGGLKPENLSGNRAFKDKVHAIAAKEFPPAVCDKARILGKGQIRLMDDRVENLPETAGDEHCIGFYTVEDGNVVSYAANPSYFLFSAQGSLELVESVRSAVYQEFREKKKDG